MMRYTFWYGAYEQTDIDWLGEALKSLTSNKWDGNTPLYFDGTGWGESLREAAAVSLLHALQENTSARSLFLRNALLDLKAQQAFSQVFEKNCTLESITLRNIQGADEASFPPASLFQNTSIREMTLDRCNLKKDAVSQLSKMLRRDQSITSLSLEKINFEGNFSVLTAALTCCQSLRHLRLKDTTLTDEELSDLLKAIGANKSLVSVHLEGLSIGEKLAPAIGRLLRRNNTLTELSLRMNNLSGIAMEAICANGLSYNKNLRALLLSHNPIGDQGAAAIVHTLSSSNTTLHRLCLANCDILKEGCRVVATGLRRIKGLRQLNMDFNEADHLAPEFLQALEENYTLTEIMHRLPLKHGKDKQDEKAAELWKKVDLYLRWNKAGRRVFLHSEADILLPFLLERVSNESDVLFQFLRGIPFSG